MSKKLALWLRLLLGGAVLFGSGAASCTADALREISEDLDDFADEVDGEDDDFLDWLEDQF